MRVVGCLSSSSRISEERCESLYSGVRGRRERERARERDQFGGKTSSVGSGPGARQAGKLRKLPHRERERRETIVGMVTLCHPYDEGITCLCDTNKAVLR